MKDRYSRALVQRLLVLVAGNVLLLGVIWFLMKEGSSFSQVLLRAGPNVAPVAVAGLGMTGIIFAGAIDLSIASIIVVAATIFGILVSHGFPPWVCHFACVLGAWSLSMANGYWVRLLRVPSIIVTLAGLAFYRGVALIVADVGVPGFSGNISVQDESYHAPGKVYAGWILALMLLLAAAWELFAKSPRRWLALGNSEEACRLLGVHPGRVLQSAYCVGGLFLGVAALIFTTRVQAIEPARMALGFELQVIGAVVLGGTNIFGGEGSYAGTVLGAFFLYLILELLIYSGVSPYFQELMTGAIILAVIGLDCAWHRKDQWLAELA
ncbi:MAG: ABC transporter permease [Verrucomicrobia bacterium]|nr:ABC transporter permease [Verrucomicrobiota bacterium]